MLAGGAALGALALWTPGALGRLRRPAAAVALAAVLAAATSINPWLSLAGSYSRYEDLPVRLAYLGLFAGSAALLPLPADRRRVVTAYLLGCSAVSLQALWQALPGAFDGRPDGNLGQPNLLGVLLAMACPLALWRSRHSWWWLLALVVMAAGLLVSTSRAAWLGAVLGCAALVPLRLRGRHLGAALAASGAVVLVAVLVLVATPLRNLNQDSGSARLHLWRDTASLVAARPLTGWGEDTLGLVFGRFLTGDWQPGNTFDRAHSQPLDLLAAQGLAGVAAATWFWARFLWEAVRWRDREEVAALLAALAAYSAWAMLNFDWAPATGPFWLLAGAGWAAVRAAAPSADAGGRSSPRRLLAGAAGASLVAAGAVLAVLPLVADAYFYSGHPGDASRLDPVQARYHRAQGELWLGRRQWRAAVGELRDAVALGDSETGTYIELGDAQRRLGDRGAARNSYQRAAALNPFDKTARQRLAELAAEGYSSSSSS